LFFRLGLSPFAFLSRVGTVSRDAASSTGIDEIKQNNLIEAEDVSNRFSFRTVPVFTRIASEISLRQGVCLHLKNPSRKTLDYAILKRMDNFQIYLKSGGGDFT
jgi:hypothetical protein